MIKKFRRGLAAFAAATIAVSSFAPVSFAEELIIEEPMAIEETVEAEETAEVEAQVTVEEIAAVEESETAEEAVEAEAAPNLATVTLDETKTHLIVNEGEEVLEATVTVVPAQCGVAGSTTYSATSTKYGPLQITESIPAKEHVAGTPKKENEVNGKYCDEVITYDLVTYCTVCKKEIARETITVKGATDCIPGEAKIENGTKADCIHAGSYDSVVYCTVCGKELSREHREIPANGEHTKGTLEYSNVTDCTKGGNGVFKCKVCGELYTAEIEAQKEHSYKTELKYDSKTKVHTKVTTCENCAYSHTEEFDHDWQPSTIVKPATCTEDGEAVQKCSLCGETKLDTLPKTGHEPGDAVKYVDNTEVDCESPSYYYNVYYCKNCKTEVNKKGEVVTDPSQREQVKVEATGHKWGEPEVDEDSKVKATCTENGTHDEVIKCTVCGQEKHDSRRTYVDTYKLGHDYVEVVVEAESEEATCAKDGKKVTALVCSRCDVEKDNSRTEKILHKEDAPHVWGTSQTKIEMDCEKGVDGIVRQVCEVCGKERTQADGADEFGYVTVKAEHTPDKTATGLKAMDIISYECDSVNGDLVTANYTCTKCNKEVKKGTFRLPVSESGHTWEAKGWEAEDDTTYHVYQQPTCTAKGKATVTCTKCKQDKIVEVPVAEHTSDDKNVEYKNSTFKNCAQVSSYVRITKCKDCGKVLSEETVYEKAKKFHEYDAEKVEVIWNENVKADAATMSGVAVFRCQNKVGGVQCNEEHRIPVTASASNKKAPTCTEAGSATYTVTIGATTYPETTGTKTFTYKAIWPATGHKYNAPEVEKNGTKYQLVQKCANGCGKDLVIGSGTVPAEGAKTDIVKEATCTEPGYSVTFTSPSAAGVINVISATGHKAEEIPAVAPTCTETGLTAGKKCSVCGEVLEAQEEVPAAGHKFVEVAEKPATCTETGLKAYEKCSVCGFVETEPEVIPALGHTVVVDKAIAATCTATGLTEGKHCAVCKVILEEQKETPMIAHTEVADAAVAATCTTAGKTAGSHCSVCGTVIKAQQAVGTTAHVAGKPVRELEKKATYTAAGSYEEVVRCTVCNAKISSTTKTLPKLEKKSQTIKVTKSTKKATFKASKVSAKKQSFKVSAKATAGALTYKKIAGSSKITVSKNGKVTIKKGTKKGNYKARVRITAAGTAEYNAYSKVITVKVVVK